MNKKYITAFVLLFVGILSMASCKRTLIDNNEGIIELFEVVNDNNEVFVHTCQYSSVSYNSFVAGGYVACEDSSMINCVGLCYSNSNQFPIYESDYCTYAGSSVGDFSSRIFNLSAKTKYYYRAYAIDKYNKIEYGSVITVRTASPTGAF